MADKGYPSRANRAWLREHGVATTIPERDDQIAHRRKKRGRPVDFGDEQRERYKGRNVVERCFNKLKQWRGIAMRSDKTARNYPRRPLPRRGPPLGHQRVRRHGVVLLLLHGGGPVTSECGHDDLIVELAVMERGLAAHAFRLVADFAIDRTCGFVEDVHPDLDAVQPHLLKTVIRKQSDGVGAVSVPHMLASDHHSQRRCPDREARPEQSDVTH